LEDALAKRLAAACFCEEADQGTDRCYTSNTPNDHEDETAGGNDVEYSKGADVADDDCRKRFNYLQAAVDAAERVATLDAASTVADADEAAVNAAKAIVNSVEDTTAAGRTLAAEAAVATQRQRIEDLLLANRSADQEEAAWEIRVAAANTAKLAADANKQAADDAVTELGKQFTERSWLFRTLEHISTDLYATACRTETGSGAEVCAYVEVVPDSVPAEGLSTSEWEWPSTRDGATPPNVTLTNLCSYDSNVCKIYGLDNSVPDASTGLIKANTDALGDARDGDANAPTLLRKAMEDADYRIAGLSTGTALLTTAKAKYKEWMEAELLVATMKSACWKYTATDTASEVGTCFPSNQPTTVQASVSPSHNTGVFNPLMQNNAAVRTWAAADKALTDLNAEDGKGDVFGTQADAAAVTAAGADVSAAIRTDQQNALARAQVNLWFNGWMATAYGNAATLLGKEADRTAKVANDTWKTTNVGAAEV